MTTSEIVNCRPERGAGMKDLREEVVDAIMQLDEIETEAMLIMVLAYKEGATDEEAAERAAAFLDANGRPGQAQAVRDTAKNLA